MHEEQLFQMVNEAVMFAKDEIEKNQELTPFAMVVFKNGYIDSVKVDEANHDDNYESLVTTLRERIVDEPKITGLAIVAMVSIPEHYKAPVSSGIRVHLEERHKSDDKIGARFLYVPYQLYKESSSEDVSMQLLDPIPVSIPAEIFKK